MTKTNKNVRIKNIILYVVVISSFFFISPVNAENRIVNGECEDTYSCSCSGATCECLNNWTVSDSYYVNSLEGGYNGTSRKARIWGTGRWMSQDVDLTGVEDLTFYTYAGVSARYINVYIDDVFVEQVECDISWAVATKKIIDISGYTGIKTVKIESNEYYKYIDNIVIDGPSVCSINYNPDIPVTNTKPVNITYRLNDTFDGYWARIYTWSGIDISSNDTPKIVWLGDEEGGVTWVDNGPKSYTTSDYFHNYDWWDLNETYGVVLYNIMGPTPGMRFDDVMNGDDPHALAWAQIYVNYSWNATPPPDPTPEPTPDPTPDPTPTGTPTPEPTATPQPEPEPNNQTLNTSFVQGYSNLVNNTVDGFFVPMYNFSDYVAQPLTSLNRTLGNFTCEMNISFTNASMSLGLSTNLLFMIMVAFPQKIINLFAYYLIWVMILLIFKGVT